MRAQRQYIRRTFNSLFMRFLWLQLSSLLRPWKAFNSLFMRFYGLMWEARDLRNECLSILSSWDSGRAPKTAQAAAPSTFNSLFMRFVVALGRVLRDLLCAFNSLFMRFEERLKEIKKLAEGLFQFSLHEIQLWSKKARHASTIYFQFSLHEIQRWRTSRRARRLLSQLSILSSWDSWVFPMFFPPPIVTLDNFQFSLHEIRAWAARRQR